VKIRITGRIELDSDDLSLGRGYQELPRSNRKARATGFEPIDHQLARRAICQAKNRLRYPPLINDTQLNRIGAYLDWEKSVADGTRRVHPGGGVYVSRQSPESQKRHSTSAKSERRCPGIAAKKLRMRIHDCAPRSETVISHHPTENSSAIDSCLVAGADFHRTTAQTKISNSPFVLI
jgi:hypothetical protein